MRMKRDINTLNGESLRLGSSLGQGTDGVGEVLRHPCKVTLNFRNEGLRLMEAPNKGSWGMERSLSDI